MQRRLHYAIPIAAMVALGSAVQAQPTWLAGGFATMPMGDYGNYAQLGWQALIGAEFPWKNGISARFDLGYGNNSHEDEGDASTTVTTLTARVVKPLGGGASGFRAAPGPLQGGSRSASLYVHGGGGYLIHKYNPPSDLNYGSESSGQVVLSGGLGMLFPSALFAEAAFNLGLDQTTFLSIGGGFRFGKK